MQQANTTDQDLSQDEILEAQAEQRRRVVAAFVLGSEAGQGKRIPRPLVVQLSGLAIALAAAAVIGLVGLVQQQIRSSQSQTIMSTPFPITSPVVQAASSATPGARLPTPAATPSARPPATPAPTRRPPG